MVEAFFVVVILVCIIYGCATAPPKTESPSLNDYQIIIQRKPKEIKPDKTIFNEAKQTLQMYGFSATEAKDLLNAAGEYNNAEEWVKAALNEVKI